MGQNEQDLLSVFPKVAAVVAVQGRPARRSRPTGAPLWPALGHIPLRPIGRRCRGWPRQTPSAPWARARGEISGGRKKRGGHDVGSLGAQRLEKGHGSAVATVSEKHRACGSLTGKPERERGLRKQGGSARWRGKALTATAGDRGEHRRRPTYSRALTAAMGPCC